MSFCFGLNVACSEISSINEVEGSSKVQVNFAATNQGGGDFRFQTPHSTFLESANIAATCAVSEKVVNCHLAAAGLPKAVSIAATEAAAGEVDTSARKRRRVRVERPPLAADDFLGDVLLEMVRGDTAIVNHLFDRAAELLTEGNQRSKKLVHLKSFALGVTPSGLLEVMFPLNVATVVLEEIKQAEDVRDVNGQRRDLLEKTKVLASCLTLRQIILIW
jgi:hypothetical protein